MCHIWNNLFYITSQLRTGHFWFDQWKHAMREQEDKMVQVSLPWNNISTVCTPRSIPVSPTAPEHFSTEQINKLESRFSHQKWPDKTAVIIIAMESNLLSKDVEVWTCSIKCKYILYSGHVFWHVYSALPNFTCHLVNQYLNMSGRILMSLAKVFNIGWTLHVNMVNSKKSVIINYYYLIKSIDQLFFFQQLWFQARREKWIQGVMAAIAAAKDSLLENQ